VREAAEAQTRGAQGRFYRASENAFDAVIAFYGRTLKIRAALPDHHAAGGAGHPGC
jgi:uncharacterized MAPEG superfamily protein